MTNFFDKIFSYKKDDINTVWRVLGFKISYKNKENTLKAITQQNNYDLTELKTAKELIIFFVPKIEMITGGILSIYSICKYSREICPNAMCLISTPPGNRTYSHNNYFNNEEKIYRWSQITDNASAEKITVHLPEFLADKFYNSLSLKEKKFLKSTKDLQINILNQNIDLTPEPSKIQNLKKLTANITQTIGHDKCATQEICNKWGIPTHFLSVGIETSIYKILPFESKEKIIVFSPDCCPEKSKIQKKIEKELPDYKIVTVKNMRFQDYMDLIARSYFSVTFGEGFDGYFIIPALVGSIGFAVYNDKFFPDKSWKELPLTYDSFDEMYKKITNDMISLLQNKEEYIKLANTLKEKHDSIYNIDCFKNNLKLFYQGKYSFLPTIEGGISQ